MEYFIEVIASSGVFAVLFVSLLALTMRDSKAREDKYVETINSLLSSLEALDALKLTVDAIYELVSKNKYKRGKKEENI